MALALHMPLAVQPLQRDRLGLPWALPVSLPSTAASLPINVLPDAAIEPSTLTTPKEWP